MKIKKLIAGILCAALVFLAPGAAPYQALAATIGVETSVTGAASPSGVGAALLTSPVLSLSPSANPTALGAASVLQVSIEAPAVSVEAQDTLQALSGRQAELSSSLQNKNLSVEGSAHAAATLIDRASSHEASAGAAPEGQAQDGASLSGKNLLLIGSKKGRDYLIDEPVAQAKRYGFNVLLLDYPEQKAYAVAHGVKPENFIAADVGNHSPENIQAISKQIAALRQTRPIDAVKTFLNGYALLDAHLSDSLNLPGHTAQAVNAAHTKNVARELMNADPELLLPSKIVTSAEDAATAFEHMRAQGVRKVVLKPASGGGGTFVVIDIDTPEKAAQTYAQIQKGIENLIAADAHKAQSKQMDQKPSILMEAQIPDGIMLDVEMLMQDGKVVWSGLSYNMPANEGNQEKGTTYPSLLLPEQVKNVERVAAKAVKALGLKTGNVHLEAIYTNQGTKVVEVNARMGGADVWENILESAGVNLIEQGILAAFNAAIAPKTKLTPTLLQHRFIIPKASGKVVSIEGLEDLAKENDVYHVEVLKKTGDDVLAMPDDSFDYLGYVTVRGEAEGKTLDRLIDLLDRVKIKIQKADGTIIDQTAAYAHDKVLVGDLQHLVAPRKESPRGLLSRINAAADEIPEPILYLSGATLLAQAIMAILLPAGGLMALGAILSSAAFISFFVIYPVIAGYFHDAARSQVNPRFVGQENLAPGSWKDVFGKLKAGLAKIPTPFFHFLGGSTLLSMAAEGISIVTSLYGINQFKPLVGEHVAIILTVAAQALGMGLRIPGSLIGAKWVKRFDATKIYKASTILQAVITLLLPAGSLLVSAGIIAPAVFIAYFFLYQLIGGLIYGATRGMAENQIMPHLVGQDKTALETGSFIWMAAIETGCLATAFGLSPIIRKLLGANWAIGIFGALMLSSLYFFRKIKYIDEGEAKNSAGAAAEEAPKNIGTLDKLPIREYIPYVAAKSLHFMFYGLFSWLFAQYTFNNEFMMDRATGFYDSGSLLIGLIGAIPALLASLNTGTSAGEKKGGFSAAFNKVTPMAWFTIAVAGAIAYLGTGLLGNSLLGLLAAAALGSLTTINVTKWMASILSRLKPEHHARIIARLSSVSVGVALTALGVIGIGQVMGTALMPLLVGLSAATAAALIAAWLVKRTQKLVK